MSRNRCRPRYPYCNFTRRRFTIWIVAEQLGRLPAILTIVAFAIHPLPATRAGTDARAPFACPAYAVWETAVFILNVIAFMLIGPCSFVRIWTRLDDDGAVCNTPRGGGPAGP